MRGPPVVCRRAQGPRHAVLDLEAGLDDVEGLEGEGGGEAGDAAGDGVGPIIFFEEVGVGAKKVC